MKTFDDLKAIREKTLNEISMRTNKNEKRIVVGMATCGIAAGARPVINAFLDQLEKRKIHNVTVNMTGCIGLCKLEPIAEVIDQDGSKVTYVQLNPQKVEKIVAEHIVNGRPCHEFTIGASAQSENK